MAKLKKFHFQADITDQWGNPGMSNGEVEALTAKDAHLMAQGFIIGRGYKPKRIRITEA
ncbi:hypothetical protein [Streptomyces sp. NPDC059604]|uniref:hypothetical protein n=1 Tax=Streptomyces sp. NPDC059604 TaxID=3346881 RepID=UPI0036CF1D38